jgi:Flp pilus assembly protein TadD
MEAFRRATEIDPRNPQAYNNLGLAALQAHHNDEAVSAFSKGVQLQANNPDSLMHLALAYKANGMEKEAEETYRRALQASQAKPK